MLYKVTPNLTPQPALKDPSSPKLERKRRKSAVFDTAGREVLITMMCLKCRAVKPLAMFGLRRMGDGAIRNQPWCRYCRSGARVKKPKDAGLTLDVAVLDAPEAETQAAEPAEIAPGPDAPAVA